MLPLIPIVTALTTIVPSIAKWIGGDKAEDAAVQISDMAKAVTGISNPQLAIDKVLQDPTAQLKFMTEVENNRFKMDEIYLADRQNARLHNKHSIFPAILCSALTLILTLLIAALVFVSIPPENMRLIDTVFGSLSTAWIGSCAYWNGTTRGSAEKDRSKLAI